MAGLTYFFLLLQFLAAIANAGFYYQRFPSKIPGVVNGNEVLTSYQISTSSVENEKACASLCSSSSTNSPCFSAHFKQSTQACILYSASVATAMSLQLNSGTSDDVTMDISPTKSKSYPNSPPKWLTTLNSTLTASCSVVEPLGIGLANFRLREDAFTASTYNAPYYPSQGRLGCPGSWCISSPTAGQWLQIKLDKTYWINYFDFSGGSTHTVYTLSVQYSTDGYFFSDANKLNGAKQIFQGATTGASWDVIYRGTFAQPFQARYVRFLPLTWSAWVCMRVELYGCPAVCREPLGIEAYEFEDSSFQSSGDTDVTSKASFGNLNSYIHYWQGDQVNKYGGSWIQIDLGKSYLVTGIIIQPPTQPANNGINLYSVQYCVDECQGNNWILYSDPSGISQFNGVGNTPNSAYRTNLFSIPFIARKVRLIARTAVNQVSGRWEILGCREIPYQSGSSLAAGKTASASPSTPTGSITNLAASSGLLTDAKQQDPNGLMSSCISVPADPKAQSYVTVDLGSSQTISDIVINRPRAIRSLDPVGLWLFDFATQAQDLSGNGADGQVGPDVTLTTGIYGQKFGAMNFSGTGNSFVHIPNPPVPGHNLNYPNSDFSIFAWIYPTTNAMEAIFSFVGATGGCCGFTLWHDTGELHTNWKSITYGNDQQTNVINYNAWNFIGVMFSTSTGLVWWYANGAVVGNFYVTDSSVFSNGPLVIGRAWDGETRYYHGKIACLQIYKRALSGEEINDARSCPWLSATPEFFWPFDATHQATDYFGNGIDGTVGSEVTVVTGPLDIPQSAFNFNGTSNANVVYSNPSGRIDFRGGLTISFWFDRIGFLSPEEAIVSFLNPNDGVSPTFYIRADNYGLAVRVDCVNIPSFSGTSFYTRTYAIPFSYPRFRHVALTYNSQSGRMTLYIESELYFKRQLPQGCILPTSGPLRIGGLAATKQYQGSIACFQMFSRELNYREVIQSSRCPLNGIKPVVSIGADSTFFLRDTTGNAGYSEYLTQVGCTWGAGPYGIVQTHWTAGAASTNRMSTAGTWTTIQQFTDSFTLMVWAKVNTIDTATHIIVLEATSSYANVIVGVTGGNQWFAKVFCTSGDTPYTVTGGSVTAGVFYHIALVRDKAAATLYLYLNAVLVATDIGPTCSLEATTKYSFMSNPYSLAASTVTGAFSCFIGYKDAVPVQNIQQNMAACPGINELSPSVCDHNLLQRYGVNDVGSSFDGNIGLNMYTIDKSTVSWIPAPTDANPSYGFVFPFEIELRMILTKGRPDADEWVKTYKVMHYSGQSPGFVTYSKFDGSVRVFSGNFDRETAVYGKLFPSIKTYEFRIYPLTWNNLPSMRVGVIGCDSAALTCQGNLHVYDRATTFVSNYTSSTPSKNVLNSAFYWIYTPGAGEVTWQQISMTGLAKITKVAVQGGGSNVAWVTVYRIAYSFNRENKWHSYKTSDGFVRFFTGNNDATSIVESYLDPPVVLRLIRFYPEAWSSYIAMRVGVFGCLVEDFEDRMPTIVVTLGDNAVTNVASALSNPTVAETVIPPPMGDRSHLHLFTANGPKKGRYLTVVTKGNGQKLDLCQVSAYNTNNQNMGLKQSVIIQSSAFLASAVSKSKAATDGNITQFDSDSAGQVCMIGKTNLMEDLVGGRDSSVVMDALPPSQCSGVVTQWEMNFYQMDNALSNLYMSTWNVSSYSRLSYVMHSSQPYLKEKAYIVHNGTYGLTVNLNTSIGFYGGVLGYVASAFGLNAAYVSASDLRAVSRFSGLSAASLDSMMATTGYVTATLSSTTELAMARGYVSIPGQDVWIAVDLGIAVQVSLVAVYVPVDRYGNSLENTEIRVGNSLSNIVSNPICDIITSIPLDHRNPQRPYYYHCMGTLWGRYAILRRLVLGVLPVAEILVF